MSFSTMLLGKVQIETAVLQVPNVGVWFADCSLLDGEIPAGQVTMQLGDQAFVGTIDPAHSGSFGARGRARIVGGAGTWGKSLAPKGYVNDAGVKAVLIAADAAREAGEKLETAGITEKLGTAY